MTPEGNKALSDIVVGDDIMSVDGFVKVESIEPTGEAKRVYELIVTGANMFYANGILAEGLTQEDLKEPSKEDSENTLSAYSKAELQAMLDARGIAYDKRATKPQLIDLLKE